MKICKNPRCDKEYNPSDTLPRDGICGRGPCRLWLEDEILTKDIKEKMGVDPHSDYWIYAQDVLSYCETPGITAKEKVEFAKYKFKQFELSVIRRILKSVEQCVEI